MALPDDFNKIFGSTATGGLTPIGDVNYAKGWEFVGSNPPTKNDFSYLQNLSDLKSQWLYSNKLQRTDPFGDINSDGTVETALANLGLGEAAKRDVGTGANQIPDMNSFHISTSQTGWCKFPNGLILQWGLTPTIPASGSVSYPIPFPGGLLFVGKNTYSPVAGKTAVFEIVNPSMTGFTAANIGSLTQGSSTFNAPTPSGMAFFAIGY